MLQAGKFYVAVTTLRGSTSSITNPIVQFTNGALHLIRSSSVDTSAWYYDTSSETLRDDGETSTGMRAELEEFLGDDYTAAVALGDISVTKEEVVGKFV